MKMPAHTDGRTRGLSKPVCVYNIWSAYDELSDNVFLTEELAQKELDEVLRLRRAGVRIDYFMMDAFWFDETVDYRKWRKPHWPNGPDAWLRRCRENAIKPGLWVATNSLCAKAPVPRWADSLDEEHNAYCLFEGSFLQGLMDALQHWYDRGFRMFKFDFARMDAATPSARARYPLWLLIEKNALALRNALRSFRKRNHDVLLVGFNGFGGEMENTFAPVQQTVDPAWLEVFDTLYCGDPRPSDVPTMSFWRSMDIYTDHMVRYYELNGVPLERIDNTGFMCGATGTCYKRKAHAWKGMLILALARGGWMNVYHGNLELLDDADAAWFAKAQALYLDLQEKGHTTTFGGLPGNAEVYGFDARDARGAVVTMVNPSQSIQAVTLPLGLPGDKRRVLFSDAGFVPVLDGQSLLLGPEQLVVLGTGAYAGKPYDLGKQDDVEIPSGIGPVFSELCADGSNAVSCAIDPPPGAGVRIVMQQYAHGLPRRSSGGAPPEGETMDQFFEIEAEQQGRPIPVNVDYDRAIWSGLSWAVGQIARKDILPEVSLTIRCATKETHDIELRVQLYAIEEAAILEHRAADGSAGCHPASQGATQLVASYADHAPRTLVGERVH